MRKIKAMFPYTDKTSSIVPSVTMSFVVSKQAKQRFCLEEWQSANEATQNAISGFFPAANSLPF